MEIPHYPHARAIDISDKPLLDMIFLELQPGVSELTFAGLYLFRKAHSYQLTMVADSLIVMGAGYDGRSYCLPPLSGNVGAALETLFADGVRLYGADDDFVSRYLTGPGLAVVEDRDAFDYLYLREELAELRGNRSHSKKNRINYFTSRHHYQTEPFQKRHTSDCLALLDVWNRVPVEGGISRALEIEAAAEAVMLADELNLTGVVIVVEGAVKAFVLGERLNSSTAVCHFEKSDPFLEGISQLVNREFSRMMFVDCQFINREQDLGEPGLRNAKLSYKPVELVKKYRVAPVR